MSKVFRLQWKAGSYCKIQVEAKTSQFKSKGNKFHAVD